MIKIVVDAGAKIKAEKVHQSKQKILRMKQSKSIFSKNHNNLIFKAE